jgi:hypothetical protein
MQILSYTNSSKNFITRLYTVTNIIINILIKFDEYMDYFKHDHYLQAKPKITFKSQQILQFLNFELFVTLTPRYLMSQKWFFEF